MNGYFKWIPITLLAVYASAHADVLDEKTLQSFARLSLECIDREFPNKTGHVIEEVSDRRSPRELHPIFYGCFDWHSSVHGHWALVKTLKLSHDQKLKSEITARLDEHFTLDKARTEAIYFEKGIAAKNYERPYGYGWFLRLLIELKTLDHPHKSQWLSALKPLEDKIVEAYIVTVNKYEMPVRTGLHENTAFAMSHAYDYALLTKNATLLKTISEKAEKFFSSDRDCPLAYEPSGEDFLSPCMAEADIMARVMTKKKFKLWLKRFISVKDLSDFLKPQEPKDLKDLRIVHLLGLNFQKAWTMRRVAHCLPPGNSLGLIFSKGADELSRKGRELMFHSDYAGTHWLASFAIFDLSSANLESLSYNP